MILSDFTGGWAGVEAVLDSIKIFLVKSYLKWNMFVNKTDFI